MLGVFGDYHRTNQQRGHVPQPIGWSAPKVAGLTKLTALEQAAAKAILPFVDPISYGWKAGDNKWQVPRDDLNRHFTAAFISKYTSHTYRKTDFLRSLTARDIARHVQGERQILVRSEWSSHQLLIRIDGDNRNGQIAARQCVEDTCGQFFPGAYLCPSDHGHSAYMWLVVPTATDDGKVIPLCTKAEMNRLVQQIHDAVQALAANYDCSIEVHGSFLERTKQQKDEHGVPCEPQTVVDGALGQRTTAKLPRFTTIEDVQRFAAARISCDPRTGRHDAGLAKLLTDAKAIQVGLPESAPPKQTTDAQRQALNLKLIRLSDERLDAACTALGVDDPLAATPDQQQAILDWRPAAGPENKGKRKAVSRIIFTSGDKLKDTFNTIVTARLILGIRDIATLESRHDEVLELAHQLWIENNLGDGNRDRKRDARFNSAFKYLVKTFDDSKAGKGNDPNWFDEPHLADIEHRFNSNAGAMADVAMYNRSLRAKLHGKLTARILAIIAATMAKNTLIGKDGQASNGDVPVAAIKAMLAHERFKLPNHGSLVAAAKKIIMSRVQVIECIAPAVKPGWHTINGTLLRMTGRAARYVIRKWHWFPFLADHAPKTEATQQTASTTTTPQLSTAGAAILLLPKYKGYSFIPDPIETGLNKIKSWLSGPTTASFNEIGRLVAV